MSFSLCTIIYLFKNFWVKHRTYKKNLIFQTFLSNKQLINYWNLIVNFWYNYIIYLTILCNQYWKKSHVRIFFLLIINISNIINIYNNKEINILNTKIKTLIGFDQLKIYHFTKMINNLYKWIFLNSKY